MENLRNSNDRDKKLATSSIPDLSCAKKETDSPSSTPALLRQVIGGGVSGLLQVGLGMVAGYSGVTLPQLTDSTSTEIYFDQSQVALFSSLVYLAAAAGSIVGVVPMVKLGQRVTMLVCLPILFVGWLALYLSTNIWMILTARFFIGLTIGVIDNGTYQYTTEIAHSSIRGMMVGGLDLMRQIGILLVYALGKAPLNWQEISLVCGCTAVVPVFVALLFLPNSPRWLATMGRMEEASKSLRFYRGAQFDINSELASISTEVDRSDDKEIGLFHQLRLMTEKANFKIMAFLTIMLLAIQFTGNIVTVGYAVPIFEVADVAMDSYTSALVVGGIRVIGTIGSLLFIDYVGRRPAIMVSFFVCGASLSTLGAYFFMKNDYSQDMANMSWLPLTSLVVFTFFSCIGHPAMHLIRAELLPTSVRSAAMPLLGFTFFGGMFLATQTFPMMTSSCGEHGAFWTYAGICFAVVITAAVFIPETRKKNLENITLKKIQFDCTSRQRKYDV